MPSQVGRPGNLLDIGLGLLSFDTGGVGSLVNVRGAVASPKWE